MEKTPRRRPTPPTEAAEKPVPTAVVAVRKLFSAETPEFFLLLGTTLFLLVFGLVMVLSSSSIESRIGDGNFFARATRQGLFAALGLPLMLLAARMPIAFWKRWAGVALVIGGVLQLLVFTNLGIEIGGNRGWLDFGFFTAQPSELIKLALAIWLPWILVKKMPHFDDWRQVLVPAGPVVAVAVGLVLLGKDLGSATIILMVVLGSAFFAGVRMRHLAVVVAVIGVLVAFVATLTLSRQDRIQAWLSGCVDPALLNDECWQTVHGWEALAHGGIFGVGLGNSAGKWSWIPAADNDFIFAIIGEELGLVGCLLVLALFVLLAISFVRIVRMSRDPFARVVTSAVMTWIIGQAFVNIAVVLGVLPVLGVPLPLVSSGGSALLTTMVAIGIVLSFARRRPAPFPDAVDVRRAGRIVR
ncbi:putative lipid II flippase FtsW [Pseudolysinimonas sp.]